MGSEHVHFSQSCRNSLQNVTFLIYVLCEKPLMRVFFVVFLIKRERNIDTLTDFLQSGYNIAHVQNVEN